MAPVWQKEIAGIPDGEKVCRDEMGRLTICPGGVSSRELAAPLMRAILVSRATALANRVAQVLPDYVWLFGDSFARDVGWLNYLTQARIAMTANRPTEGVIIDLLGPDRLGLRLAYESEGVQLPSYCDRGICYVKFGPGFPGGTGPVEAIADPLEYDAREQPPAQLFPYYCSFEPGEPCNADVSFQGPYLAGYRLYRLPDYRWAYDGVSSMFIMGRVDDDRAVIDLPFSVDVTQGQYIGVEITVNTPNPTLHCLCISDAQNYGGCVCIDDYRRIRLALLRGDGVSFVVTTGYTIPPDARYIRLFVGAHWFDGAYVYYLALVSYLDPTGRWITVPRHSPVGGCQFSPGLLVWRTSWYGTLGRVYSRVHIIPEYYPFAYVWRQMWVDSLRVVAGSLAAQSETAARPITCTVDRTYFYVPWIELGQPLSALAVDVDADELVSLELSVDGEQTWQPIQPMTLIDVSAQQPTGFALRGEFKGDVRGWALLAR